MHTKWVVCCGAVNLTWAMQFHAVQHDMRTVTTQRKPRCTCDEQFECETKALHYVSRLSFSLCLLVTWTAQYDSDSQTRVETCLFRNWLGNYFDVDVVFIDLFSSRLFAFCVVLVTEASTKGALFCKQEGSTHLALSQRSPADADLEGKAA